MKNIRLALIILSITQNLFAANNISCILTVKEKNSEPQIAALTPLQQNLLTAEIGPFAASVLLNSNSQNFDLYIADEDGFMTSAQVGFDIKGIAILSMSKNKVWVDLKCEKILVY